MVKKKKPVNKLAPCKYCKNRPPKSMTSEEIGGNGWCVQCDNCWSTGPIMPTKALAQRAWNAKSMRVLRKTIYDYKFEE